MPPEKTAPPANNSEPADHTLVDERLALPLRRQRIHRVAEGVAQQIDPQRRGLKGHVHILIGAEFVRERVVLVLEQMRDVHIDETLVLAELPEFLVVAVDHSVAVRQIVGIAVDRETGFHVELQLRAALADPFEQLMPELHRSLHTARARDVVDAEHEESLRRPGEFERLLDRARAALEPDHDVPGDRVVHRIGARAEEQRLAQPAGAVAVVLEYARDGVAHDRSVRKPVERDLLVPEFLDPQYGRLLRRRRPAEADRQHRERQQAAQQFTYPHRASPPHGKSVAPPPHHSGSARPGLRRP